jgi:hypothetical protein
MKIKWNWGTKLTIVIVMFMLLILSFVYRSFQRDVNLVEKDYYPKGLAYQQRIEEQKQGRHFEHQVSVVQKEGKVIVNLPQMIPDSGMVLFFRPSSRKEDIRKSMPHDTIQQIVFEANKFKQGRYILKLYWEQDAKKYYIEKTFNFKE